MSQKRYVFDDAQKSRFLTYLKRNKELNKAIPYLY